MADKLISQLTATAGVVSTDVFEIEKLAGPPSEKATVAQLITLLNTIYAPTTGGLYVLKSGDTMTGPLLFSPDNMVDVGSGAARIKDLYVGGTASITAVNAITSLAVGAGGISNAGNISMANAAQIFWATRSVFASSADGIIKISNNAETDFNRLQFGGTTSAFPSIQRSGAGLRIRLADDSAYGDLEARIIRLATAFTVATLPAAGTQGRMAYVTDALTPTFLTLAVGGGAIVSPVFDNGTNWVTV